MKLLTSAVALAAAALAASPAAAQDRNFYVGIEGGAWFVNDIRADADGGVPFIPPLFPFGVSTQATAQAVPTGDRIDAELDTGYDIDAIAGYDWGFLRTEVELAHKRADFDQVAIGDGLFGSGTYDAEGNLKVTTLAVNALADMDIGQGFSLYAGPGFGWAWIKAHPKVVDLFGSDSSKLDDETADSFFIQGIAGIRKAITSNIEVGAKYRYISSGKKNFDSGFYGDVDARLTAHSLMASLIYNFGGRAAPAPEPAPVVAPAPVEPAPATQTCPDGSVIDATATCPAPAPAPVERG